MDHISGIANFPGKLVASTVTHAQLMIRIGSVKSPQAEAGILAPVSPSRTVAATWQRIKFVTKECLMVPSTGGSNVMILMFEEVDEDSYVHSVHGRWSETRSSDFTRQPEHGGVCIRSFNHFIS